MRFEAVAPIMPRLHKARGPLRRSRAAARRETSGHRMKRQLQNIVLAAAAGALLLCGAAPAKAAEGKLKVAFFGFELINTSPEPVGEGERRRIALIGEAFAKMLADSGRYEIAPLPEALRRRIAQSAEITGCNGCEIEWAREAGADIAAFGTVQKVSNLILNENIYMNRVDGGAPFFSGSVDIRGNTDESWSRGMKYLMGEYFLKQR
jgi:hypothetical protein